MTYNEAKLDGVKIFGVVLFNKVLPKEFPQHLLKKKGLFLLNLKSHDEQSYSLKKLVYFKEYALHIGAFYDLAKQVILQIGDVVGPKSKHLIALKISDYLKCCLRYHQNKQLGWLRFPTLLFVVDILVDLRHHEEAPPRTLSEVFRLHHEKGPFCWSLYDFLPCYPGRFPYITELDFDDDNLSFLPFTNTSLDKIPFTPAEYHEFLEPDDVEVVAFIYSELMLHANVKCSEISKDILSSVFIKQKQTVDTKSIGDGDVDGDIICSICLEKISTSEAEDTTILVRCKHVFHRDCIFKWLPGKHSCPYCRSSVLVDILL